MQEDEAYGQSWKNGYQAGFDAAGQQDLKDIRQVHDAAYEDGYRQGKKDEYRRIMGILQKLLKGEKTGGEGA